MLTPAEALFAFSKPAPLLNEFFWLPVLNSAANPSKFLLCAKTVEDKRNDAATAATKTDFIFFVPIIFLNTSALTGALLLLAIANN